MGLTREQIVNREIEYFKSDLAIDPAFVANYDDGEGKCVYKTEDGRKELFNNLFDNVFSVCHWLWLDFQ